MVSKLVSVERVCHLGSFIGKGTRTCSPHCVYLSGSYHGRNVRPIRMREHVEDRARGLVTAVRAHSMLGSAPRGLVPTRVGSVAPATHFPCVLSLLHRDMGTMRMMVAVVSALLQGYAAAQEIVFLCRLMPAFKGDLTDDHTAACVPWVSVTDLPRLPDSSMSPFPTFTFEPAFPGSLFRADVFQVVFLAGKRMCSPAHHKSLSCDLGVK